MRTKRANIDDFMNRTKTDLVSGNLKQVDFIESTAEELQYLQINNRFTYRQKQNFVSKLSIAIFR